MTHKFSKLVLTAGLSALLGTTVLSAQNPSEIANVPFNFHTSQQTLSSGTYKVAEASPNGVLVLTGADRHSIYIAMRPGKAANPNKPNLKFACYAGECVLASVSMPGRNTTWDQSQSAIEKNLTHKLGVAAMIAVPLRAR